jgi:mono/diheme cytochrome c family protein
MRHLVPFTFVLALVGLSSAWLDAQAPGARNPDTWHIPANAEAEQNPLEASARVLGEGKKVYGEQCRRCHGESGKGDGPDADPERKPADLTRADRADRNPDGVMFYKVWNGRRRPTMPAFKNDLTKNEVWSVIHYVRTLRAAS